MGEGQVRDSFWYRAEWGQEEIIVVPVEENEKDLTLGKKIWETM